MDTLIKTHIFIDGELHSKPTMLCIPRIGDHLRYVDKHGDERYAKVGAVFWCLDEWDPVFAQRVNISASRVSTE